KLLTYAKNFLYLVEVDEVYMRNILLGEFGLISAESNPDIDEEKIASIVKKVYGGDGVDFLPAAKKEIVKLTALGYGNLPVCMAKTQYSFSDDPVKLGAPTGFRVTVRNVKVSAGAGFIVALTGDIMTMPGLPKSPAAERIDVDENGKITGLF
ncbi:MAG: formate--tetrahydrofolate ligase, partial [Clostridia bacterium]|nr:formate--tetrahydrofolate ligase [Clostridia bacterium]